MKTFAITLSVLVLAIIAQEAYGRPGGFRHRARREAEDFELQPCNSLNFANGTSVRCEQPCNTSFTCVAYGSPFPVLPGVLTGAFSGVSLCVADCGRDDTCNTGFTCTNGKCWPEAICDTSSESGESTEAPADGRQASPSSSNSDSNSDSSSAEAAEGAPRSPEAPTCEHILENIIPKCPVAP